jgi:hypothetical protein
MSATSSGAQAHRGTPGVVPALLLTLTLLAAFVATSVAALAQTTPSTPVGFVAATKEAPPFEMKGG